MNFVIRNKQLFGLFWEILVVVIFKFYNNYIFTDIDVYIFLSLLILPILFLEILAHIKRRKNLSKFKYMTKETYEQIKLTVEKDFIKRFENIYSWHEFNKKEMQFAVGNEDIILIRFEDNKTSLEILGTNVKYNFYYGKTLKGYQKYDKHGFEHYDIKYLYDELYDLMKTLLNGKVILENYYVMGIYNGCKLLVDNEVIYEININSKALKTVRKKEINF